MWNGRVWLSLLLAIAASGAMSEPGWAARHHRPAAHRHVQAPGHRRDEAAPLLEVGLRHARFLARDRQRGEPAAHTIVGWTGEGGSAKGAG